MVTLHAYVLRELLKSFGLSLLALTILVTMGGGLFNVVSYQGTSAADFLQFLPLLIPIAITFTMPVAALFAATMVYGRLSADNEFTACRAAGINVHRLFLSAVLLSVFVTGFMFLSWGFVLPSFAQRGEAFLRNNLRDLFAQHVQNRGFFQYRGGQSLQSKSEGVRYTLTAEDVRGVAESALVQKGFEIGEGLQYLLITSPTFLQADKNGQLVRFAAARYGLCRFDTRGTPVEVTIFVRDGCDFEVGQSATTIDQQQIGPLAVATPSPFRLSSADLASLLHWREAPWEIPKQRDALNGYLAAVARERFYEDCRTRFEQGQDVVLFDDDGSEYRLRGSAQPSEGRGFFLAPGQVVVRGSGGALRAKYEAPRIKINAVALPRGAVVEIRLMRVSEQDVLQYDAHGERFGEPLHKPGFSLDNVRFPAEFAAPPAGFSPAQLLSPAASPALTPELSDQCARLQKGLREEQYKVIATIHFRLGCTASALVTVVMGAMLGVIFRGARALAACALGLIPFLSVLFIVLLGQQLTQEKLVTAGVATTWGGLVLGLAANGLLLRLGVRR